jgi:sugar lactone lactonase YvrE
VFGHVVPTSVAYHGNFYVGNLGTLEDLGLQNQFVAKVTPSGQTQVVASGLQTVLGLAFDNRDRMYVLDMGGYVPGQGRVLRIDPSGATTEVASGFDHPTGIAFGPDGALYVSDRGFGYCSFGSCPADGQIVRIANP